jgi:amidophosphoribosyltransferase
MTPHICTGPNPHCFRSPDGPKEACGVFGVYGHPEAAKLTYFGLYALQHRGQESAGIVCSDGKHVTDHRHMGLVSEGFSEPVLAELKGHIALGHVRYSTTGSSLLKTPSPAGPVRREPARPLP